ncbi:Developmentally regulated G-protein 1 [Acorus calamus]|uniref:Developmentally regulated G-protein 1 n=1 Tax=Acorus calamus TaxID=4465 RepID=A0AAV9C1T7_ACOCL|nr:Developmentally regulated G-protein 1 [Acorus calamus]
MGSTFLVPSPNVADAMPEFGGFPPFSEMADASMIPKAQGDPPRKILTHLPPHDSLGAGLLEDMVFQGRVWCRWRNPDVLDLIYVVNGTIYRFSKTTPQSNSSRWSVGKSTLLTLLTGTHSEAASYEFTTLTCIPGIIHYNDCKIQLLDLPGIIEGASEGKGRGRQDSMSAQ